MRTVTYRLADLEKKVSIHIGRLGENEVTRVQIDAGSLFAEYPDAVASMSVENPEGVKYPATVTRDGDMVIWDVRDSDLAKAGHGEIQWTFTENGAILKSAIARTSIGRSIVGEGTPPDPLEDWIEHAEDVLEQVDGAFPKGGSAGQVLAKKSGADYDTEWVNQGSGGTGDYEDLENLPKIGGVELKGDKSLSDLGAAAESDIPDVSGFYTKPSGGIPASDIADGVIPDVSGFYTKPGSGIPASDLADGVIPDVSGFYTKPSGGIPASDIADGVIPDPEDLIDDTAGAGDTEKVWSADKSSSLLRAINKSPEVKDSTKTGVDLDVSDDDGNVLVRFKDGDIQTKNFDSASTSGIRDSIKTGIDLDVSDDDGNVILRLKDGHIQTKKFTSETIEDRTTYVTVKSSGGDFTTLRGAIDYINTQGDADPDTHPYVIQIYPGTYDVLDDYTDEEIRTADVADYHNGFFGPYISDGMSLVGIGDRETIVLTASLDPEEYNSTIRHNISTLNTQGNCRLENLTIIAEDIRYCVHDDFSYPVINKQYERVVKNCKFVGISLAHNPSTTWGGGMDSAGENALFENCDFGTDFGCHFNGQISTRVVFRNCCGRKLRLAERNVSVNHYVIIEDSNFEFISLMRPSNVTAQHIKIISNGCNHAYVSFNEDDIVLTGAVAKAPLASLPVGTMVKRTDTSGNGYESTSNPVLADGVVVANDDYFTYIQRTGYINTRILGITSFSIGDYITIDGNNKLTDGGTASNAVGVISFISQDSDTTDQGIGFVKLLVGGMK